MMDTVEVTARQVGRGELARQHFKDVVVVECMIPANYILLPTVIVGEKFLFGQGRSIREARRSCFHNVTVPHRPTGQCIRMAVDLSRNLL